ncbi:hypothetical protein JCM31826_08280 [Thermaurantimonas aggregans]|uniref:Lipid-A-disaccharide synthase n=1 Tax=Thermaurantimonas aggregans TaxID=2173829 RepID=A0A401XJZ9_9FLAO|nr:hypothetical protein [Thermaurantimonas aggregans]GCD77346.1 hypothetical protein JCM31826_08280 [Thermaurantimonas aggregans]
MYKALCLFRDQFMHIKPVEEVSRGKINFIYDSEWKADNISRLKPDIVIGINEHHLEIAKCYEVANKMNIPTLTIQDGVLEWRYMFENPMFDGDKLGIPLHRPILANKYACIGTWWASLISAMGNANKVEVTGMPKMDTIDVQAAHCSVIRGDKKKIMVITAAKPWFEDNQKKIVLSMLTDLKDYFDKQKNIEVVWRITKALEKEINVTTAFQNKETSEIAAQIEKCDAVISTISTSMIEVLLKGKPLARIDYFNTPCLFPTVWNITNPSQIDDTIRSLLNPKPQQLYLQEIFKMQVISNLGNASERVSELILKMIDFNKKNSSIDFPSNLVGIPIINMNKVNMTLSDRRESLMFDDINWLKAKLVRLEWENYKLKKENAQKRFINIIYKLYNKLKA